MSNEFIPYGRQQIDEDDIKAVNEVLQSPWLTTGPMLERFEKVLAHKVGASFCVAFNSGTAALHAAYFAAGIQEGDEVITSPLTFMATANAALYLGGRPVFVDIVENSFNIDAAKIEEAITSRTKIIAPVDMSGMPAELDEIMSLARHYNLTVVEDGCHALGAIYKGRPVGSIADMTVFSFHPVKHITTGEGGAVTTDSEDYCRLLKTFRSHGVVRDVRRYKNKPDFLNATMVKGDNCGLELSSGDAEYVRKKPEFGSWYYEQHALGYNYRLSDINCALGLSQLKKLDPFLKRRREIAGSYHAAFNNHPHLKLPPHPEKENSAETVSAWHLYILRLAGDNPPRRRVVEDLYELGVGTQVHYLPVYLHPYYQDIGYQPGLCPIAEDYYGRAFTIPLFPGMSDEDVQRVIEAVLQAVGKI